MKKTTTRIITAILTLVLLAAVFSACSPAKDVTLTIDDSGTKTEIKTQTGKTVADVLSDAKITLGDKDETSPKKDEKIAEDTKEIIVMRYAKVTIVKDGKSTPVEVVGGTVEEALKKAGITLADAETVDADLKSYLKDGMTINVIKALKVSLTADGKTNEVATKAATVQALLDEQKITLGKDDEISEKLDAKLSDGMKITVKRVEYKNETKTETIEYGTDEQYSDSLSEGDSEVTQEGVNGEKEVTYKVKYVDGKEADREKVSEKVTKEAVDQIVTYGTYSAPADNGSDNDADSDSDSGSGGKTVVSVTPVYDCDGSGHGYNEIHYSDGSVEYEDF